MRHLSISVALASLVAGMVVAQAVPQRVRVLPEVMQTKIMKKVSPVYPTAAKKDHIEGVVVMKVLIDKKGNVENTQLVSGHPALAQAAIDAVKQWKYKPYLLNGEPVEVETQVSVNFTLAE